MIGVSRKGGKGCVLDGTVRLSRPRPISGVNHSAPTRLADGKASLDPLRSVQFRFTPATLHTTRPTASSRYDSFQKNGYLLYYGAGMVWYGMVEVCEGAPVAVSGWVLTDSWFSVASPPTGI